MLRYEYLKKEWIVPTARCIYRISASLSLALFFAIWLVIFEGGIPEPMAAAARLLFLAGALGAGITLVGMEFFLFRFDDSQPLKQVVWFCVMLFPFIGQRFIASWSTCPQNYTKVLPSIHKACHYSRLSTSLLNVIARLHSCASD